MIRNKHHARLFFALVALVGVVGACASAPRKQLADAQAALTDAYEASECAPEEYAAARKMLEKAQLKSDAGEYDEARELAVAARDLARRAAQVAKDNYERCKKRNEAVVEDYPDEEDESPSLMQPGFDDEWQLKTVYFGFNAAQLAADAQAVLKKNAEWMLRHAGVRVTVAGHCDSRGSTEYNLALGETRAYAAKKYLVSMGVPPDRLAIISYGEEVPIEDGVTESAYSRNRRAEFRAH
jgi:peptidoglycan-associated lipoprotein